MFQYIYLTASIFISHISSGMSDHVIPLIFLSATLIPDPFADPCPASGLDGAVGTPRQCHRCLQPPVLEGKLI